MRKQYKIKRRSCGLCKPHKKGWDKRWKHKDRQKMIDATKDMRNAKLEM